MFEKILTELTSHAQKPTENERLIAPNGEETALDQQRFSAIIPAAPEGRVLFVDGGNAPVFESPAARIEFVRVYGAIYDGVQKVSAQREEGFVLIRNVTKEKKGYVEAQGHGVELKLMIPDDDKELKQGRERVSLATAAGLARFCLECRLAAKLAGAPGERCTLIVRDGTLLPNNGYEDDALKELSQCGVVAGLSKTNTLTTTAGNSISATLLEHGPKGIWSYGLGEEKGLSFSIVKLHAKAEHAFRLDAKGDATGIAAALAAVSSDPVFPGYPYPLIEADKMARVPNKELELLKTRFMVEAGSSWKTLQRLARGSDGHAILDRIS